MNTTQQKQGGSPGQFLGKVLKEIVGRLMVLFGLHHRLLRGNAIVVAFHSVTPDFSDGALRCSVKAFEEYCAFFARHLEVLPLTRLVDRLAAREPIGGKLSITFDDGYVDNVKLALPVLQRWSLPATFFVTSGFIETQTQTFWDSDAGLRSEWMSWPQVVQLAKAGHEIGAHTVTHADLGKLSIPGAESELRGSRDVLAARIGSPPLHFAVPFGRPVPGLENVAEIARRLGFRSLSLCRGGLVPPSSDPMRLERWPIRPRGYLSPYGWLVDVVRAANSGELMPAGQTRPVVS
jgi:peptidoglycan/xylan/chitin deacetylase (PgdA/CDA1 family)